MPAVMPFIGPLDDVVDDRLLQRVVVDGPCEQAALGIPGRRRYVDLTRQPGGDAVVQAADHLVPLALLIVSVVTFVVEDHARGAPRDDAVIERLDLSRHWPAGSGRGHRSSLRARSAPALVVRTTAGCW